MWIKIRTTDGPNFSIPVPLFIAGMPFVWRMIAKNSNDAQPGFEKLGPDMVRELRRYVRKCGHFTLVEVNSSDGDIVKITV